jgi:hypothetical protein
MVSPRSWLKKKVLAHVSRRNDARRVQLGQERGIAPETFGASVSPAGHLVIGGCDVADLARRFGTPLYVVDAQKLRNDYAAFSGGFSAVYPHVEIGYSYKTNPLPGVIRVLHDCGALAEVISGSRCASATRRTT